MMRKRVPAPTNLCYESGSLLGHTKLAKTRFIRLLDLVSHTQKRGIVYFNNYTLEFTVLVSSGLHGRVLGKQGSYFYPWKFSPRIYILNCNFSLRFFMFGYLCNKSH